MRESVQEYYGKRLSSSDDLQTNACCDGESVPEWLKPLLAKIHPEVAGRYYGCGLVVPEALAGRRILDLGCGAGRDVFVLSALVGAEGSVVGVDMTPEQLEVARAHVDHHREVFGLSRTNVEFREGYIEELEALDLEPASFDLVVSNCVLNLSTDKGAVLRGVRRLLRPGGEMYFSDVYTDRRVPAEIAEDAELYGECLGGALYWHDFLDLAREAGFADPRLVRDRPLELGHPALRERTGSIRFFSATYRLFAIDGLESACEDYGQAVLYRGTIEYHPDRFVLDKHHVIDTGRVFPVCGNTYRMLSESRFADHFEFYGDGRRHFGIFAGCGVDLPFDLPLGTAPDDQSRSGGCC